MTYAILSKLSIEGTYTPHFVALGLGNLKISSWHWIMKLTKLIHVTLKVGQGHSYAIPSKLSIEGTPTPNLVWLGLGNLKLASWHWLCRYTSWNWQAGRPLKVGQGHSHTISYKLCIEGTYTPTLIGLASIVLKISCRHQSVDEWTYDNKNGAIGRSWILVHFFVGQFFLKMK